MKPHKHAAQLDSIVRDLFRNGGPQLATDGGRVLRASPAMREALAKRKLGAPSPCPALARPPRALVRRQRQPHPVAHREAAWAGWALVLGRARP